MRTFKSQTLAELVNEVSAYANEDDKLIGLSDYGDHCGTMQVIPLNGLEVVYVQESGYSSSGFRIIDADKADSDDQQVVSLNPELDMDIDSALTAEEFLQMVKEQASDEMMNMPITYGSDYGDRSHTTQANRAYQSDAGQCEITESSYSDSGYAEASDEDGESGYFQIG